MKIHYNARRARHLGEFAKCALRARLTITTQTQTRDSIHGPGGSAKAFKTCFYEIMVGCSRARQSSREGKAMENRIARFRKGQPEFHTRRLPNEHSCMAIVRPLICYTLHKARPQRARGTRCLKCEKTMSSPQRLVVRLVKHIAAEAIAEYEVVMNTRFIPCTAQTDGRT